jgi:hypothetical protein
LSAGCNNGSSVVSPSLPPQVITVSGSNVLPISVNPGPVNNSDNIAYATVTVCVPGTTNCQTINDIQIDTGSSGLRILSSALSLPLPQQTDPSSGNPIVECLQFVGSYSWGPVQTADVQIAGEQAHTVPIQVIGSPAFPAIPDACSSTGPSADTVTTFGANGLLGVGVFQQDCGSPCVFAGATNPNFYYTCPASGCQAYAAPLAQQVPNPVSLFLSSADTNGVIVELPTVAATGQGSVSGSLVFGIGTQSNNAVGTATRIPVDGNGDFTTVYKGQSYTGSYFDTGSDALYFLDSVTAGLPLCADASYYYCPTSTQNQSASVTNVNGTANAINFSVANADTLFVNFPAVSAFINLGGPNPGSFDWGLPFFFGRNVFVGLENENTPLGLGPYWAF